MRFTPFSLVAGAMLISGITAGCTGSPTPTTPPVVTKQLPPITTPSPIPTNTSPKIYTDVTQVIEVKAGDEFIIGLESNPTTGYSWQNTIDGAYVQFIAKDFKPQPPTTPPLVGAGGTDYVRFKALKTGETKITLSYYQPWMTPNPVPAEQKVFTVKIS